MHSDSFFVSGNSHKVCQDYARSGKINNKAYSIISDGCSSSPDTDFGARFLTISAIKCMEEEDYNCSFILNYAKDLINSLLFLKSPLDKTCLDATILIALEKQKYFLGVDIEVAGDGVVIARKRSDKSLSIYSIEFNQGAPAYLSYLLDKKREQIYFDVGCGERNVKCFNNGQLIDSRFDTNFFKNEAFWRLSLSKDEYDLVVICSDGIHSFQNKETLESIPLLDIVNHIMDFKTFNGEFVVRRMKKFLVKTCKELNWDHYDDLSVGAIYMDD